jgi:ADP-ribose pyrophosphatase
MTQSEVLFNGQWLRLMRRGRWEYAERTNQGGASAVIVAVTDDDHVVFVEQYRVPIERRTIEMPAGLIGDSVATAGEDVLASAARELEEETGFRAARVVPVMQGPSSAGMSSETMHFVRAFGLTRVGPGGGDGSEDIQVHLVPRADCARFLADRHAAGYGIDPKLYAGLYFIDRDARGEPWPAR